MDKTKKKRVPTKTLLLSIIAMIVIGALHLSLPICNKQPIEMIDLLFLSTSAVCVTGLTPVVPIEQFTIVGQVILLILIQIGGIGFMTLISLILIAIGKKLNLSDKILIRESLNQDTFKGLVKLIKKICIYTCIIESLGALILAIRFIPDFGIGKGIWFSIFHAISAFCNAGFDLLGNESITAYSNDGLVCTTIMILIIIGGLGFTVWDDIVENIKNKEKVKQLSLHTKIVLTITTILLITGTLLIFIIERENLQTMGNDNLRNAIIKICFPINNFKNSRFLYNGAK